MSNILVTTIGATWQNLPLMLGVTNPNVVDLYRLHPSNEKMKQIRDEFGLQPVNEIWVVTIESRGDAPLNAIQKWHALLEPPSTLMAKVKEWPGLIDTCYWPILKIFRVSGTDGMASENECRIMKEAILRIVLHAAEYAGDGQLLLSFAGGSMTMIADMQLAAMVFGCDAMMQVVETAFSSSPLVNPISDCKPEVFTAPLPADFGDVMTVLVTGKKSGSILCNTSYDGLEPIQASDYPMMGSETDRSAILHIDPSELSLSSTIDDRSKYADFLWGRSVNAHLKEEKNSGFPSLYCLPARVVERLKGTVVGVDPNMETQELRWLNEIPKAVLHCQLEGVLDVVELVRVANANYLLTDRYKLRTAFHVREWRRMLDRMSIEEFKEQSPLKTISESVRDIPEPVSLCAFLQLFNGTPGLLDELIFGRNRSDANFVGIGVHAYEALGELQGARLLQSEVSIRETCRVLVEKAEQHNVRYLEVLCSPIRYMTAGLNPIRIVAMIEEEIGKVIEDYSIIFTIGRHRLKSDLMQLVNVAKRIMENPVQETRLRGYDLAENEATSPAREMRKYLSPLMEKCQHVTVNALGNADAASIWETVYHLNAERVCHALNLWIEPDIQAEFLDREIAIEMCPSSDLQILGFRDNYLIETQDKPVYPLQDYLDAGLKVTVCADNPGISRTDFTRELHRAARLTPGGLSIWSLLKIVYNGFVSSFADHATRNRVLRQVEKEILNLIERGIPF